MLKVIAGLLLISSTVFSQSYELVSAFKPATASSVESSSYAASFAFDGNEYTRWASSFVDNEWLQVDLQAEYKIGQLKIYWETAFALDYAIKFSNDGSTWRSHPSAARNGTNGDWDVFTADFGTARYVRLICYKRATEWGSSLWEFKVYADMTPSSSSSSDPVSSSSSVPLSSSTLSSSSAVYVKSSKMIAVTGTLTDLNDSPVNDNVEMYVRVFDHATSGNVVYTEEFYGSNAISVQEGAFSIPLGKGNASANLIDVVSTHDDLHVEITIGREGYGDVMGARVPLSAAPFLLK